MQSAGSRRADDYGGDGNKLQAGMILKYCSYAKPEKELISLEFSAIMDLISRG